MPCRNGGDGIYCATTNNTKKEQRISCAAQIGWVWNASQGLNDWRFDSWVLETKKQKMDSWEISVVCLTACRRGKERLMVQAAMLWGRRRTKKRAAGSMNGGY